MARIADDVGAQGLEVPPDGQVHDQRLVAEQPVTGGPGPVVVLETPYETIRHLGCRVQLLELRDERRHPRRVERLGHDGDIQLGKGHHDLRSGL
jgi:hypothetical protein